MHTFKMQTTFAIAAFFVFSVVTCTGTRPKYDLSPYDGLFFSKNEIKNIKNDPELLYRLSASISRSDKLWTLNGRWPSPPEDDGDDDDDDDGKCKTNINNNIRPKRRVHTCSSCCQTKYVAERVTRVNLNDTTFDVVQPRDRNNYNQVIIQGMCASYSCGGIRCEEDRSLLIPVLIDNKPTSDSEPPTRFLPLLASRFCRCRSPY